MSVPSKWTTMGDFVFESKISPENSNLGPNIQSKFIFGVESVKLELQRLLFLKVLSTCICIIILVSYIGTLISTRYTAILDAALKPFLEKSFPDNQYRFQQDNDPKHVSNHTGEYFQNCGINWWRTPPESPDLNPIENVCSSLKYFLCHQHKPKNLETLISGIKLFWMSLTPAVCSKYISHIHKVIPKVIEVEGRASGY